MDHALFLRFVWAEVPVKLSSNNYRLQDLPDVGGPGGVQRHAGTSEGDLDEVRRSIPCERCIRSAGFGMLTGAVQDS